MKITDLKVFPEGIHGVGEAYLVEVPMFQILIASMAMAIGHQNGVANIAPGSLHMARNTVIDKIVFGDENARGGLTNQDIYIITSVYRQKELRR